MSLYDHEEAVKKKAKMKQLHTKMLLENFLAKCIESKEKRKIQIKAEKVKAKVNEVNKDTENVYIHSLHSENELKTHIANLRAKIYPKRKENLHTISKIDEISEQNLKYLTFFQNYKKNELQSTKEELEIKIVDDFQALMSDELNKMNKQIQEEKTIFNRMYDTKKQISLIKDNFQGINDDYSNLSKENVQLKLKKELKLKERKALIKLYKKQKKINDELCKKLELDKIEEVKLLSEEEENDNEEEGQETEKTHRNCKTMTTCFSASTLNTKTLNPSINFDLSELASFISEKNKELNKIYQQTKFRNNNIVSQRSQMTQFLQRCIDDLKVDYQYIDKKSQREKNEEIIKNHKLSQIQNKIIKLSFIYDNCFLKDNDKSNGSYSQRTLIKKSRSKNNLIIKTLSNSKTTRNTRKRKIRLQSK